MSRSAEQVQELFDQALRMPRGPAQYALLEQVIGHADALGRRDLGFRARRAAMACAGHAGEASRGLVSFAWCLAEFDRDPQAYADQYASLLWEYRHAVRVLRESPDLPLQRVQDVLDDMSRRYAETGHTMHAVYAFRHMLAAHIGDLVEAERYFQLWCAEPRDRLSSCDGCDPAWKAAWLTSQGRDDEALALVERALAGRATCEAQPQRTLTVAMLLFLRAGEPERARDAHRRAYRRHRTDRSALTSLADHVEFCARTGNEARAVEILRRHLPWLAQPTSPWAELRFTAAAALALRSARERHPAAADEELEQRLTTRATELGARFDRRNGTDHVGTLTRATLTAHPWVDHLAL